MATELCRTCRTPLAAHFHDGPLGVGRVVYHFETQDHDWDAPRMPVVQAMREENAALKAALRLISEGMGRFSRDPLTHCENTVEDMKALARAALGEEEATDAVH
ncbi:hypothetical protein LCGC14_1259930 [marine sediment metagenome]|uniref:Uncharacterized protein n=1 Tax=marine sediment metagenome TaxID=412755 RepID=A0A0F9L3I2_9ZZZZ